MNKARIKKVQGGTLVEVYSEQRKKWYSVNKEPMPRQDAVRHCLKEGYEIVRSE
jgi:hypothetical protein